MYTIEDVEKMKHSTEASAYNFIGDKIRGINGIYKIGIEYLGEKGGVQIGISCYREHRGPSISFSTNKINNVFLCEVPNGLMMTASCHLSTGTGRNSWVKATFSRVIYNINYTSLRYITDIQNIIDDHIIIDEIMKTILSGKLFFTHDENLLKHNFNEKVIT
jgi:hypothetical protein